MYKKLLFPIVFLIIILTANALTETPTLKPGESFVIFNKNITLVSSSDNSVILCVNGEKAIVSKYLRTVNEVVVDLKRSSVDEAQFELSYKCITNCICDETCATSNKICLKEPVECITDADCNDNNPVTYDMCSSDRKCLHTTKQVQCTKDTDCNDNDDCTADICSANQCTHTDICGSQTPQITKTKNNTLMLSIIYIILIVFLIILLLNKKKISKTRKRKKK